MDAKINTDTMKVNSLSLIGEEYTKEPIKVLEVLSSEAISSKVTVNPTMETGPPKKRITLRPTQARKGKEQRARSSFIILSLR